MRGVANGNGVVHNESVGESESGEVMTGGGKYICESSVSPQSAYPKKLLKKVGWQVVGVRGEGGKRDSVPLEMKYCREPMPPQKGGVKVNLSIGTQWDRPWFSVGVR